MAQEKVKYDFNSEGESVEEFKERTDNDEIVYQGESLPVGIRTPIRFSSNGDSVFEMHTSLKNQILDNLRNLLLTNHSERLMFPDYGANIRSLAMEMGNPGVDEEIMRRIRSAVTKFMPFISLQGFEPVRLVGSDGSLDKLSMIITFSVTEVQLFNLELEISFYEAI